ncbi:hypothetical protein HPB47_015391, partial [Ixodes persulcatus]
MVNEAKALNVLADETMDIGGLEQMSCMISAAGHWQKKSSSFRAVCEFICYTYEARATMGLRRLNGLQAAVLEEHPSHSINLVLCDAATVPDIRNCMSTDRDLLILPQLSNQNPGRGALRRFARRDGWREDCILTIIELLEPIAAALQQLDETFDASDPLFYPNIRRILQILVALPVTTAKAERSLSTLRRLNTYLRATMSQARL